MLTRPWNKAALSLLALTALSCAGCGVFRDHSAEDAALAALQAHLVCENDGGGRLQIRGHEEDSALAIVAVDGRSTLDYWGAVSRFAPYPDAAAVNAGMHIVHVRYSDAVFTADGVLNIDAASGARYTLRKKVTALNVRFWIEDSQGRLVGAAVDNALQTADHG